MTTGPTGTSTPGMSSSDASSNSGFDTGAQTPPLDTGAPGYSGASSSGSTTEAAKEQATQVGQTAKQAGTQVASTAKDEARNVAGEARAQARNLLGQTQSQVTEQASAQKSKAAGGLRSVAEELRSMAQGQPAPGGSGKATDLTHQAADSIQQFASWLESREPADLLEEIRDFARRRPGAFLLGAAAAGVVAGRLTRGAVDASRSSGSSGEQPAWVTDTAPTYDPTYDPSGYGTATAGAPPGYVEPGGGTRSGDDIALPDDTVVVETDPFGPRSQRTVIGGERP